ncbi:phage major capsid protein [Paenibacillus eucommiae]|uniref:HK97 family phage major capsid protein n=1 Tax=Paenibacillus eucommiae TaxID=1355755 RepID=A0ABS4IY80_9BACL|nr:phage major capsid protein [Paenibacillus eucommiae]MBP1992542.1 HK97 family phage major capsid protein [Paenibacillus eucommiae]
MNKKKLLALLAKKEARKAELGTKANAAEAIAELRSINAELETLNAEIAELRSITDAMPDDEPEIIAGGSGLEQRSGNLGGNPLGSAHILGTYGTGSGQGQQQRAAEPEDFYGTLEYRKAFMSFAKTGEMKPELRANAMTTTADVSAVIPTTILNEIIKKITVYGQVFARVRKLNVKGGVDVPILSLKPVATWIGQTPTSDKQKLQANTKVSFSYYGLECKVSISLLADTVTLDSFETVITDLIVEAMVKAIDLAVIKGDGVGKPLGVTLDPRVPATQIVTMSPLQFANWEDWAKKVLAKMPLSYKAGATFLMASGTFEGYINGMVDDNGQPIGRVNYGITEGPQERFGGKEVIQVEDDVIAPFADAATGDVVAVYCNLKNYGFNSNMQMTMFRYFDHDTNEWVDKAILIADGKLVDPNGVVIIKKGAAV